MEPGARFRVFATPRFAFLAPDGQTHFRTAGAKSARVLLRYNRFVRAGHYRGKSFEAFAAEQP
jgi:hypothetical protein